MSTSAQEHGSHEIHLPKPTFWPLIAGLGFALLPLGFITWAFDWETNAATYRAVGLGMLGAGLVIILTAVGGWTISNIRERLHAHVEPLGGASAAKFAMWCFLGTEVVIFGGLIARAVYVWMRDPTVNEILHHLDSLLIVSVNTFLLLLSSLCVVLGVAAIQRGDRTKLGLWMFATAALGAAFISIQGYEYSKLFAEGITLTASPFSSGFFFLTGFHGLHVFAGVIWGTIVGIHALRGGFSQTENIGVEVFGLYWHFVDVVWIFIFTLVYLI